MGQGWFRDQRLGDQCWGGRGGVGDSGSRSSAIGDQNRAFGGACGHIRGRGYVTTALLDEQEATEDAEGKYQWEAHSECVLAGEMRRLL